MPGVSGGKASAAVSQYLTLISEHFPKIYGLCSTILQLQQRYFFSLTLKTLKFSVPDTRIVFFKSLSGFLLDGVSCA